MGPCKSVAVSHMKPVPQHKDVSAPRQVRDVSDTLDLIDCLNERDPFVQNDSLFNIANDMTAQERVNVEKARYIGVKIVESMMNM